MSQGTTALRALSSKYFLPCCWATSPRHLSSLPTSCSPLGWWPLAMQSHPKVAQENLVCVTASCGHLFFLDGPLISHDPDNSFSLLKSISLHGSITFCLFIHPFYIFGLLLLLLWAFHIQAFVWTIVLISLGYRGRCRIARSYCNSIINLLRNCQIVFQNDWIILHSHQQCTMVVIIPHSC